MSEEQHTQESTITVTAKKRDSVKGYHNTTRPRRYSFLKLTFLRQHLSKKETSPSAVVQKAPSGFRITHSQTHLQCSDCCWVNLAYATLNVSSTTTRSSLSSSSAFGHGRSLTGNQAISWSARSSTNVNAHGHPKRSCYRRERNPSLTPMNSRLQ